MIPPDLPDSGLSMASSCKVGAEDGQLGHGYFALKPQYIGLAFWKMSP